MPYRRLPNSDEGRQKALNGAWKKSQNVSSEEMAIVPKTYERLAGMHGRFDKEIQERAEAKSARLL